MCDFIDWLGTPIYESKDNPLLQSVKFFGRAQLQYAYVDGEDVNGDDFSADFDEIRRLRLGTEVKFLNYFKAKVNANLEDDNSPKGQDRDIQYSSLDEARVSFDIKKAFGAGALDGLTLNYGRHKVKMSQEVHTSSKKIKTVERSAPANKIYPVRMTGATLDASQGNWAAALGLFTTDDSRELASWNAGAALYGSATVEVAEGHEVILDFLWNDANGDAGDNRVADNNDYDLYEWALSAAWVASGPRWEVLVNGMVGDNGSQSKMAREGNFYGLVVMPSYEIVEDRLEGVLRYSYQGAEEDQGIRTNSRYFRRDHGGNVNSGRGDEHHSIYAGLNYFLCGHEAKFMAGVELESLDTPGAGDGDADGVTYWLAFRTYF
ncbi:MAG: hypothetical protein HKO57_10260, partial [Akkermansiaceae bacterium]|nr:hypothetical protein [Akkermansiaceae bacterium]